MNWVARSDAVTTATAISADNEDGSGAKIQRSTRERIHSFRSLCQGPNLHLITQIWWVVKSNVTLLETQSSGAV